MRRLTFSADGLSRFAYEVGQDIMFTVPADRRTVRRRYTIRRLDTEAGTVAVDAVLHGHGPAARWFSAAAPGDTIVGVGPRGKITLRPDVEWHLFVGDDAAVPVTLAWLEAVAGDAMTLAVLEVEGPEHEQAARRPVTWLHRGTVAPGDGALLLQHLETLPLPDGPGAVYLNGERSVVRAAKDVLVRRGVDPGAVSLKAYWVRDESNGDHGEPMPDGSVGVPRTGSG